MAPRTVLNPRDPKGPYDLTVWVGVEGQTFKQMLIEKVLRQNYGHYVLETSRNVGGMGADSKGFQQKSISQLILEH